MTHQSVLLQEAIEGLAINPDGIYIDATFGRGGHSRVILDKLSQEGRLLAIDKDLQAIEHAKTHFANEARLQMFHGSFADIGKFARHAGVAGQVNGVLLDLGVSSPQLDDASRGFSFTKDGPLDMRMDISQPMDAEKFVNETPVEQMAAIFKEYGEERFARRIAKAIEKKRQEQAITGTLQLAEIVKEANPKWEKHKHPATRVFQAIRIYINQELDDLTHCLQEVLNCLTIGGRLVVISFHSLEDRRVKQFMRQQEQGEIFPVGVPVRASEIKQHFKRIGKAIKPSAKEVENNVRARSAVLRIGEKKA